jgi:hypothetical protein
MFQARECHHFLHQFPNGWPVEEFLKTYLKNKCTYAYKWGYLTEKTSQKQDQYDHEEEQEQEERLGGKDKGKRKGKEIEEYNGEIEDPDADDFYGSNMPV